MVKLILKTSVIFILFSCGKSDDNKIELFVSGAQIAGVNGMHFGPDGLLYAASVIGSDISLVDTETKKIIRIMPNVMASNNKSQTHLYVKNKKLMSNNLMKLLSSFGKIINVRNEDQINFATSVYGSGPAFIAYIVSSFVKASKKLAKPFNINELEVLELFKNVLEINTTSKMLDSFISSISSKKGTTQAGVNYIKAQKIEKIIYTTLHKAYKRAKEIDSEQKSAKTK